MAKLAVLIEGYAEELPDGWRASSTATLIQDSGKNIIVDPGCNRSGLLAALEENSLKAADMDFVLLTHSHLDHTLLAGVFENAQVITASEIYKGDRQTGRGRSIPGTEVEIIATPGHCPEHCSLLVPTGEVISAVVGDVFWWRAGEKQYLDIKHADHAHPEEVDMNELIASRKKILDIADYIIPGHGKVIKVK